MAVMILIASMLLHVAAGFSSGAGGCPGGTAAVSGSHLSRTNIVTSSLSDGNLQVSLDGVPLVPGTTVDFTVGEDHTLTLSGSFRGFLFRLGGNVDTTAALSSTDGFGQLANVCVVGQGVGGVTHSTPIVKTQVTTILRLDEEDSVMPLDVTSVIENRGTSSEYYYSNFLLNAVPQPAPPTSPSTPTAPVPAPTTAPTTAPPVAGPTMAPTTAPPVALPTPSPGNVDCSEFQETINVDGGPSFRYVVSLDPDGSGQGNLTLEMTVDRQAWVAFGVSDHPDGKMVPGEALVGLPDSGEVVQYRLGGQFQSAVQPLETLTDASVVQTDSQTIMTFTRQLIVSDRIAFNGNGTNRIIWAYGASNEFQQHPFSGRGLFTADLVPCGSQGSGGSNVIGGGSSSENTIKKLYKAHGVLAAVSWSILAPLAIAASLLRNYLPEDSDLWFQIHRGLNLMVVVCTVAAFACAVRAVEKTATDHFSTDFSDHRVVGLVVLILVFVQALLGLARPGKPKEGEKKSAIRLAWEVGHRFLGVILLAICWWQVQSGLGLYATQFLADDLTNAFWGVVGGLCGVILIMYFISLTSSRSRSPQDGASKSGGTDSAPTANAATDHPGSEGTRNGDPDAGLPSLVQTARRDSTE